MTDHAYKFPDGYTPEEIQEHLDKMPKRASLKRASVAYCAFYGREGLTLSAAEIESWDRAALAAQQLVIDRVESALRESYREARDIGYPHSSSGIHLVIARVKEALRDE